MDYFKLYWMKLIILQRDYSDLIWNLHRYQTENRQLFCLRMCTWTAYISWTRAELNFPGTLRDPHLQIAWSLLTILENCFSCLYLNTRKILLNYKRRVREISKHIFTKKWYVSCIAKQLESKCVVNLVILSAKKWSYINMDSRYPVTLIMWKY